MGYSHIDTIKVTSPEQPAAVVLQNNTDYIEPFNNSYWLGIPMINMLNDGTIELLVNYKITVDEFFQGMNNDWCEIMQIKYVQIENTRFIAYHAVIKTFWLREFQRHWRKRNDTKRRQ